MPLKPHRLVIGLAAIAGSLFAGAAPALAHTATVLSVTGNTLHWNASARSHEYLESRTTAGGTTYVRIDATRDTPRALAGVTVTYRVRPRYAPHSWSNEVSLAYPHVARLTRELNEGKRIGREITKREAKERAEREAKELAEREAKELAEREAKERAEREAKEKLEREAKERAEREAKELAEREAKERAEREAKERAEREAKEKLEREAREKLEREARERLEREAREKLERERRELEEPVTGASVSATPIGPPIPIGGWHVAYADGFGAQLGTSPGQDNTWKVGSTPAGKRGCCNNSNEVAVERPSQVSVTSEGLKLTCEHLATAIEGLSYACGGVGGALCCTMTSSEPAGYHTPVITLGKGQRFAFQFKGKLPPNLGGADPGWWMDGPPWSESEFDFFETFGWGHEYTSGSGWTKVDGCFGCWFASPHPEMEKALVANPPTEPEKIEHTYTTYIFPTASGGYRFSTYIDGVRQLLATEGWSRKAEESPEVKSPREARLNLELTYMLRAALGANNFTSGSNSETVRSVAVYVDAGHAGVGIQDEGIAPGTVVK